MLVPVSDIYQPRLRLGREWQDWNILGILEDELTDVRRKGRIRRPQSILLEGYTLQSWNTTAFGWTIKNKMSVICIHSQY